MSIAVVPLSEADPTGVRELVVRMSWRRAWSNETADDYIAWRFGARSAGEALVACDRGRPVGFLDSFLREYRIGEDRQLVRETCDWFCHPDYRAFGVGLLLMRRMMAKPEPILVIGGTKHTQDLLPRLKWTRLTDVDNFVLGISARTLSGLVAYKRWKVGLALARWIPDIRLVRSSRYERAPTANCETRARQPGDREAATSIAPPHAVAPTLDAGVVDWLTRAPAVLGRFLVLDFYCDGAPVGVTISRLHARSEFGCISEIVHVHAARFDTIEWMVGETVRHLVAQGAGAVTSRTSCQTAAAAMSALGFRRLRPIPTYWWPANKLPASGTYNLSRLTADEGLQFE